MKGWGETRGRKWGRARGALKKARVGRRPVVPRWWGGGASCRLDRGQWSSLAGRRAARAAATSSTSAASAGGRSGGSATSSCTEGTRRSAARSAARSRSRSTRPGRRRWAAGVWGGAAASRSGRRRSESRASAHTLQRPLPRKILGLFHRDSREKRERVKRKSVWAQEEVSSHRRRLWLAGPGEVRWNHLRRGGREGRNPTLRGRSGDEQEVCK